LFQQFGPDLSVSRLTQETMAQRIIALLCEPERSRAMGARGCEVIEEKFSSRAQLVNTEVV
jgi:hypothetical protein